jgi:thiamine-phosphate pyrophosphorylase
VGVLVRDPALGPRPLAALASSVIEVARPRGARVLVSHDAEVAAAVGADGVHLRESSVPPRAARAQLPSDALVGASRHDRGGVLRATREGADLLTVSPFGYVPEKGPPLGPEGLRAAIDEVTTPVFALGGVEGALIAAAVAAGAWGVAVRRAVFRAEDPAVAVSRLLEALDEARSRHALDGTRSVRRQ